MPPEQVDPALPPTLSSDGWDVEDGGGLACSSGAAAARNVSSFLAAHPEVTRPAALATARLLSRRAASALPPHAQPLARGLRAAGSADRLLFALFNSTSTHALPALIATAYDSLLANATAGGSRLSASASALPYSKRQEATLSAIIAVFASIMVR